VKRDRQATELRELDQSAELEAQGENPEDLEEAVSLALAGQFHEIHPEMYDSLVEELRRLHADALARSDFTRAGQYDRARHQVLVLIPSNTYEEFATAALNNREEQLTAAKEKLDHSERNWRAQIDSAKHNRDAEIQKMRSEFEETLKIFNQKFDLPFPAEFRKYSPVYLQLRQQEKFLALTKRFQEAKDFGLRAAKLAKVEEAEFQKNYIADLNIKKADMTRKNDAKIACKESNYADQIFILERESRRDLEKQRLALKALEMHSDQADLLASLIPEDQPLDTQTQSMKSQASSRRSEIKTARSVPSRSARLPPGQAETPQERFRQRSAINKVYYSLPRL
jgi:hypothetical protein